MKPVYYRGCANHTTGSLVHPFEHTDKVSVTVPDRTLSLRDMITRHNSGGAVKSFTPVYLGETNQIPVGFEKMSLIDRAELAQKLPDFISTTRGRLQTMKAAKLEAMKKAEAEQKRSEYERLRAEFEAGTPVAE